MDAENSVWCACCSKHDCIMKKARLNKASVLCGINQSPIDWSHTFANTSPVMFGDNFLFITSCCLNTEKMGRCVMQLYNSWIIFLSILSLSRSHSQPGAAVPDAAAVPLPILHPDALRPADPEGRDIRPHQHRDGHCVRLSLPERRGTARGEGEGQTGRGRMGLGKRGGVSPSAVHTAFPWTQYCCPAGYPGLRCYITG